MGSCGCQPVSLTSLMKHSIKKLVRPLSSGSGDWPLSQRTNPSDIVAVTTIHSEGRGAVIVPVPDSKKLAGIWRVNEQRMNERIEGQRDLVAIAGKAVIPPIEEKFYPACERLRWREENLVTSY